jgi:ubiquinone biosynthesis protein COQ4
MLRSAVARSTTLSSFTRRYGCSILLVQKDSKSFSVLNRPKPNYPGHVPLTWFERVVLGIGAGIGALLDKRRGGTVRLYPFSCSITYSKSADLVGIVGEVTGNGTPIERVRDTMLSNETGRRILRDRPRINSETLPMEYLRGLPENTVGRIYADWLDRHGMSPDDRSTVQHIDDEECAYVMQRYRECHDIWHAVLGIPASYIEGEIALKAFEFMTTRLPVAFFSLAAVVQLKPEERSRFFKIYLPWALKNGPNSKPTINVYLEEEWCTDRDVLLRRLEIEKPPDIRELRRADRGRRPTEASKKTI